MAEDWAALGPREKQAPGPRGRSGTPSLTWVKLSRNAWRDVLVRERFAGRGALPTHLILDLAMNFKHSAHLLDTAEGPAHPERTPPCLALQLAFSATTGRKRAGSTHSGGQHLPLEESSPARTSRSSGGDPPSCQLPLWAEINGAGGDCSPRHDGKLTHELTTKEMKAESTLLALVI